MAAPRRRRAARRRGRARMVGSGACGPPLASSRRPLPDRASLPVLGPKTSPQARPAPPPAFGRPRNVVSAAPGEGLPARQLCSWDVATVRCDGGGLGAQPKPNRLVRPLRVVQRPSARRVAVRIEVVDRAIDIEDQLPAVGEFEFTPLEAAAGRGGAARGLPPDELVGHLMVSCAAQATATQGRKAFAVEPYSTRAGIARKSRRRPEASASQRPMATGARSNAWRKARDCEFRVATTRAVRRRNSTTSMKPPAADRMVGGPVLPDPSLLRARAASRASGLRACPVDEPRGAL